MTRIALAAALVLGALPCARAVADDAQAASAWSTALYLDGYFVSGEKGYMVPTLFADRGPLHLEARYNYEALDTASLFAGWSFDLGEEGRSLRLTPMVGGAFGDVKGVAPGLEIEAEWGRVAYWLEAEYLFDVGDSSASYLYTWSELNVYALRWLWLGASVQRLKVVQTATELDVGPMVGVGNRGVPGWSLSFYAYGLTRSTPTYLLTAAVMFF
jgi:hypothetical protein